ncbi:ABC transporter ATP-binding protein [Ornithinibacillus salinisoli]|uniref:ABC transporter ATP-binding protein n=1 Tax=Ornithinibacillus salinisoli TaxID=1848459 RepID=A0ABW4VX88_9BACI
MKGLQIQELTTKIRNIKLLDCVSLEVESGTIMALVGHNGAGKSTLMKTILGMLEKSSGKIIINEKVDQDESFIDFKELISYLPEEPLLLTELTVMQHFQLYGKSYQIEESELLTKVNRLLEGFELRDKLNEYPESLSKGMRQKVQTICALLPDVPILLIDEPFMGLDIYAIEYLETLIREKAQNGTTILLTTHQLDRVKNMAGHYVMLQHGKVLNEGSIEDFDTIKRRSDDDS